VTRRLFLALVLAAGCGAQTDALVKRPPEPPPGSAPRPAPPPPGSRPATQPPLRQELSPEEEHRLAEGARQNIGDVARLLAELEGRSLKPPQQEALQNARTFLDQARTALAQRDYPRAANLASKARALTDDVAATSKQ
jgi:hypothetical protein